MKLYLKTTKKKCHFKLLQVSVRRGADLCIYTDASARMGFIRGVEIPEGMGSAAVRVQKTLFPCNHPPSLALILYLFPASVVILGTRACDIYVPFRAKNTEVSYSLHYGQLWVSLLITIHYK